MCLGGWGESTTVTFWGLSNTMGFCQGSFKESIGDRKGICHVGELLIFMMRLVPLEGVLYYGLNTRSPEVW